MFTEGNMPYKPALAIEIVDKKPVDWSPLLLEAWGDVMNDPAEWAKAAEKLGAAAILLRLSATKADGTPNKSIMGANATLVCGVEIGSASEADLTAHVGFAALARDLNLAPIPAAQTLKFHQFGPPQHKTFRHPAICSAPASPDCHRWYRRTPPVPHPLL